MRARARGRARGSTSSYGSPRRSPTSCWTPAATTAGAQPFLPRSPVISNSRSRRLRPSFRTFAPDGYGPDALYVLTPDVMGALVDHAADFDVEMRDDTVVFFRQLDADYTRAADWERVDAALTHVVPRLAALSRRYVDERVPGQGAVEISAAAREVATWRPPSPLIGRDGRRLDARTPQTGRLPVIAKITWIVVRTGLYVVPGVFAFAGFFKSIVDGR